MVSSQPAEDGHLAFYEAHQISPVQYRASSVDEHLDRRDALYRALGLPPAAFKGLRVLEVAAGSGQNSLYVAACHPARLELVEPNPTGRKHIAAAYHGFKRPHTAPIVHAKRLQEFDPTEPFDIVICEGWLGSLPADRDMLRKLVTFVAPGGVLITTIVPLSGFFSNVMRKLFALRLARVESSFDEQTRFLVEVFGPHLSTMPSMTRSHEDWVQDCMINPHFLNVVLPLDVLIQAAGMDLEMLATFPRFDADWRWFKALTGPRRDFNRHFLDSYRANVHNFVDYRRRPAAALDPIAAAPLDKAFAEVHQAALDYQRRFADGTADGAHVGNALRQLSTELDRFLPDFTAVLEELEAVWSRPALQAGDVRDMKLFGPVFGREFVHVSLTRPRA